MALFYEFNNSFELNLTPSRKRKRNFVEQNNIKPTAATSSCFTNAAFSSTPKKSLSIRRNQLHRNKENFGLEVKSIPQLPKNHEETNNMLQNPYEVLRKPPKKKSRHCEENVCFANPALNLDVPEKLFNPYEVVREITPNKNSSCFSNPALNLKVQDDSVVCNPFEVQRNTPNRNLQKLHHSGATDSVLSNPFDLAISQSVLNPKPCKLKLAIPFIPKVGCRIDFKDVSHCDLTPSKLLAEKLIFSPVAQKKINLDSVEEESTMDIGKELDRYQLELENSINEAKLRKTDVYKEDIPFSPPHQIHLSDIEKKSKFTQKLCGIPEDVENEQIIEEPGKEIGEDIGVNVQEQENTEKSEKVMSDNNPFRYDSNKVYQKTETDEGLEIGNLDELYGCSADDQKNENSFDKTMGFVRAYTKPDLPVIKPTVNEKSLEFKKHKSGESTDHTQKSLNIKNIIRKSMRRLVNAQHHSEKKDDLQENFESERKSGFINTVRQSLRRKQGRNLDEKPVIEKHELSIIDYTERTMKLKSDLLRTEYVKIEDLTNEKKHNLRNGIRKSTRDVRNKVMKSIFHTKYEDYDLNK